MGQAVETAVALIEDEIANLRSLITELRPAALDELGLGAAIEGLADNHAAATGMDTQVSMGGAGGCDRRRAVDRELESSVYRLVQEALTNVAKHAEAQRVWIEVEQDQNSVSILVRDDGVGFDMDSRPTASGWSACASGSRSRRQPQIVSTPGVGTVLRGRIPLEAHRGLRREDVAQACRAGRSARRRSCLVRARSGRARSAWRGGASAGCGSGGTRPCGR